MLHYEKPNEFVTAAVMFGNMDSGVGLSNDWGPDDLPSYNREQRLLLRALQLGVTPNALEEFFRTGIRLQQGGVAV